MANDRSLGYEGCTMMYAFNLADAFHQFQSSRKILEKYRSLIGCTFAGLVLWSGCQRIS